MPNITTNHAITYTNQNRPIIADLRDTLRNHSTKSLKNNQQQSKQSDLHYETDHNIETSRDQTTSINVIINSNKGHYFAHSIFLFHYSLFTVFGGCAVVTKDTVSEKDPGPASLLAWIRNWYSVLSCSFPTLCDVVAPLNTVEKLSKHNRNLLVC